mmetsp:Transcript_33945/g.97785  ORF Transcript_33945/g.97785 Transcript_33945/m.97785 type:complete len:215 (-) Transcript_33945:57-701(-)
MDGIVGRSLLPAHIDGAISVARSARWLMRMKRPCNRFMQSFHCTQLTGWCVGLGRLIRKESPSAGTVRAAVAPHRSPKLCPLVRLVLAETVQLQPNVTRLSKHSGTATESLPLRRESTPTGLLVLAGLLRQTMGVERIQPLVNRSPGEPSRVLVDSGRVRLLLVHRCLLGAFAGESVQALVDWFTSLQPGAGLVDHGTKCELCHRDRCKAGVSC